MKRDKQSSIFYKRILTCTLTGAMIVTSLSGCGKAVEDRIVDPAQILEETMEKQIGTPHSTSGVPTKEEVVYVLADANGRQTQVIVSDWLKNTEGLNQMKDQTNLKDIENISGDESFENEKNGNLVWNASGHDIHYQGTTQTTLPVDVKVTYYMDGKEMAPDMISGKSGRATIRFDYENHEKRSVQIGKETREIYVPFTMLSGVIFNNDHFSNVAVTNGRIVSTDKDTIVIGMAFPGLRESLDMDALKEKLEDKKNAERLDEMELPDYVEIQADTDCFTMNQTMTMALADMLSGMGTSEIMDIDTGDLNHSMDKLSEGASDLADGSKTLFDGTRDLSDGAKTLADKSKDLSDGAVKLEHGAASLDTGAGQLLEGVTQLAGGAGELEGGIHQVDDGAKTLANGAQALADGTVKLVAGTTALKNGAENLAVGTDQLQAGATSVQAGAEALSKMIDMLDGTIAGKQGDIEALCTYATQLSTLLASSGELNSGDAAGAIEQYNDKLMELQTQKAAATEKLENLKLQLENVDAYVAELEEDEEQNEEQIANMEQVSEALSIAVVGCENMINACDISMGSISQIIAVLQATEASSQGLVALQQLAGGIATGLSQLNASIYGAPQNLADPSGYSLQFALDVLNGKYPDISGGAPALATGAADLTAGISMVQSGAKQLDAGVGDLATGADALKAGAGSFVNGTKELAVGTGKLSTGASSLKDGAERLQDGTQTLKTGTSDLWAGTKTLQDGTVQFMDGSQKLAEGTVTLSNGSEDLMEGMFCFKEEGIDTLTDLFGDQVQDVLDTLQAILDAGEEYNIFSQVAPDMDASVKFIYKTDAIQ